MSRKDELESILLKPEGKLVRAAMPTQQWATLAGEYIGLRTGTGGQVHGRYFDIPQDSQPSAAVKQYFPLPDEVKPAQPSAAVNKYFPIPAGDDNEQG